MTEDKVKNPRVSALFNARLRELDMSRSDFIKKFHKDHGDGSRNHLFKILNGQVIAGERGILPMIVESMGLDLQEVIDLVHKDKIEAKN